MNPEPIRVDVINSNNIRVDDHVRIVNLLKNKKMPVGIVERIDGAYIYVWVDLPSTSVKNRCVYETYENELVKVTKAEYFKLILSGANEI